MGIQTFDESRLRAMGRMHLGRREHVVSAIEVAQRLDATTSGDLLINMPGQTRAQMLAGEWTAQPENHRSHHIVNHMFLVVLDPDAFGGADKFQHEVREMTRYLHETTPARGFDRVRVPGDPEEDALEHRTANGIDVDDASWAGIVRAAQRAGLSEADLP